MILMATINGGTKLIDGYTGRNQTVENFTKQGQRLGCRSQKNFSD